METVKDSIPGLKAYRDDELLELISIKDDLDTSHQAFHELYSRYKDIIYGLVNMICSSYTNKDELAGIVFNNTFFNAYQYSHTFSCEGETDAAIIKKRVIGWLLAIAKTDLKSHFLVDKNRDKKKEEEIYQAMLKNAAVRPKSETYNEKIVRQAVEQIPKERDREIFAIYWLYYEETEGGQARKLPDYVYPELCEKYNTTEPNIRKIISRSKQIVNRYLQEHYKKLKS